MGADHGVCVTGPSASESSLYQRLFREHGPVLVALGQDDFHILARGGKGDAIEESGMIERRERIDPLQRVAASGIIFGQGESDRIVRLAPVLERAVEVPRAGADVRLRIVEIVVLEIFDFVRLGPHLAHLGRHLHQAVFVRLAVGEGIEPALAPDQRADEERIDPVVAGDADDERIVDAFLAADVPASKDRPPLPPERRTEELRSGKAIPAEHGVRSNLAGESARLEFARRPPSPD